MRRSSKAKSCARADRRAAGLAPSAGERRNDIAREAHQHETGIARQGEHRVPAAPMPNHIGRPGRCETPWNAPHPSDPSTAGTKSKRPAETPPESTSTS